jgi:hypothetical protein
MTEFTLNVLIALIGAIVGAVGGGVVTEWVRKRNDVTETRRAIERKLASLLSPYTLDAVFTQADIRKIRMDWSQAADDFAITVNGALPEISGHIDGYLDQVLEFARGNIGRSELERKRQLVAQLTIARVPSIRARRR